jgi:hypothetical protein
LTLDADLVVEHDGVMREARVLGVSTIATLIEPPPSDRVPSSPPREQPPRAAPSIASRAAMTAHRCCAT